MNPRGLRGISLERLAIWIALAAVAVFVVWFAIRIREIVIAPYQNADLGSSLLLAEFFPDRGSGAVVLGKYPWYEGLLPLHWTRWLPEHVAVWKAAPYVIYGLTVLLVGWTVKRTVSLRAGLVVALAMAAPAPFVIYMLGVPNQRLPVLAHTVVLAAFLVTIPRFACWRRPLQALWAGGLALTLAPGVASDALMYMAAVIPFLAAVGLGWRLRLLSWELAGVAAGACLAGVAGGWLLEALAEHNRIVFNHGEGFEMATAGVVVHNVAVLFESVALFAHGTFAHVDLQINAFNAAREAVAVAAIAATAIFGFVLARSAPRILGDEARTVEQRLLAIYWGASIAAVSIAFIITTAPTDVNSVRYVTTFWPALLTLIAIFYGRRAISWLALLAAGCAILGSAELARGLYTPAAGAPPDGREAELVEEFAEANRLDHGYAGYWEASPLSIQTDFRVPVYPIEQCLLPEQDHYCPNRIHFIESWYEPKDDVGTFYVVNANRTPPFLEPPPAQWGLPIATATLGDLTIYAYDYDIASRLDRIGEPGETAPGVQRGP
jgi:hypothetical protein